MRTSSAFADEPQIVKPRHSVRYDRDGVAQFRACVLVASGSDRDPGTIFDGRVERHDAKRDRKCLVAAPVGRQSGAEEVWTSGRYKVTFVEGVWMTLTGARAATRSSRHRSRHHVDICTEVN